MKSLFLKTINYVLIFRLFYRINIVCITTKCINLAYVNKKRIKEIKKNL